MSDPVEDIQREQPDRPDPDPTPTPTKDDVPSRDDQEEEPA